MAPRSCGSIVKKRCSYLYNVWLHPVEWIKWFTLPLDKYANQRTVLFFSAFEIANSIFAICFFSLMQRIAQMDSQEHRFQGEWVLFYTSMVYRVSYGACGLRAAWMRKVRMMWVFLGMLVINGLIILAATAPMGTFPCAETPILHVAAPWEQHIWASDGSHDAGELLKYFDVPDSRIFFRVQPHSPPPTCHDVPVEHEPARRLASSLRALQATPPSTQTRAPRRPRRPRVAHRGENCWNRCRLAGGFCEWCGRGNACCREGWTADPAECRFASGFVTARHECVYVAPLRHAGEECWYHCGHGAGFCDWCGAGNACCRQDYMDDPVECLTAISFNTTRHECVRVSQAHPPPHDEPEEDEPDDATRGEAWASPRAMIHLLDDHLKWCVGDRECSVVEAKLLREAEYDAAAASGEMLNSSFQICTYPLEVVPYVDYQAECQVADLQGPNCTGPSCGCRSERLSVWFHKNVERSMRQVLAVGQIEEEHAQVCHVIRFMLICILATLNFCNGFMFVVVTKFVTNRCGDHFELEAQFDVTFSSDEDEDSDFEDEDYSDSTSVEPRSPRTPRTGRRSDASRIRRAFSRSSDKSSPRKSTRRTNKSRMDDEIEMTSDPTRLSIRNARISRASIPEGFVS